LTVKCKYCEKEYASNRSLHPHEKFHCKMRPGADSKVKECQESEDGKHDWKMCKASYGEPFITAMNQGYKKFCDDCGELA
jgi:hypothetical protein